MLVVSLHRTSRGLGLGPARVLLTLLALTVFCAAGAHAQTLHCTVMAVTPEAPLLLDPPAAAAGARGVEAVWTSEPMVFAPGAGFVEALLSWNVDVPPNAGVRFEIRTSSSELGEWTDWMFLGDWGDVPPDGPIVQSFERTDASGEVRHRVVVETDVLVARREQHLLQWRVVAVRGRAIAPARQAEDLTRPVRVERVAVVTSRQPDAHGTERSGPTPEAFASAAFLPVPFKSQRTPDPRLSGRLCSPTSVAMVMGSRGADRTVSDVAWRAYDRRFDIYGNWPRNIQAAFSLGVPGYLTRLSTFDEAAALLRDGHPLIISIQVRRGELRGAPYESTGGHLIVLTGLTPDGGATVSDPASGTPETGELIYRQEDLRRVWLERTLGTTYVLLPRPEPDGGSSP